MIGHEFLHAPGPTHVPDRVLRAMHRQPLDLVDARLHAIAQTCFSDLAAVFRTSGHVFVYAANGHGGWEAALGNICVPGDTVLVPEVGHFSSAWADHARALGLVTESIPGDWRHAIDPQAVEDHLRRDGAGRIKAVLAVQVDTGTGIVNDIAAIRAAMDAAGHPALLVADTIASLGAMPFEMDGWGVDVAIAASQKALMCPPGLAILAANARAVEVSARLPRHQRYWDWQPRLGEASYMKFCGTMPEGLFFGLREALDMIGEQGLPEIWRRHARLAGAVGRAVECWGEAGALSFNALRPAERAVTVTAIRTAGSVDADRIRSHARQQLGVSVAGGLGALAGHAFRIGHLGDLNEPMILGCLAALELCFLELGVPHGRHGVRAAIDYLAASRAEPMAAAA
ncbi:aminotransferase class V-fold PLP-dependent enzyme [Enterovirga sp.]|uniref:pyridoxal-phosphate-dependent aminotransferase family protein n=1 Tax=Enterovirga sp. TaxID=2026350 RepID=UPI002632AAA9|nr:aminotransferase class V-fold PLP-dependent enzyme [Enterovirga sp.]MDB5592267.1 Aminotransferase, class superfamily [Enterovirga sp.]